MASGQGRRKRDNESTKVSQGKERKRKEGCQGKYMKKKEKKYKTRMEELE